MDVAATATAITRYNDPDNLGSTNVTSDSSGNSAQWLDYAPYGSVIASENTGTTTAARQYIGQFSDASGLSYLNSRYYNGAQGQFVSEDPVFLALGNPTQLQQLTQQHQNQLLMDPQALNSYSYSEDNPIFLKDPLGLEAQIFSGNPVVAALEYFSYLSTLKDMQNYVQLQNADPQNTSGVNQSSAQVEFDTLMTGAGFLATKSEAATLTVAGTSLQLIDYYCSGHTCLNFAESEQMSPQQIANNVITLTPTPELSNGPQYTSNVQSPSQSGNNPNEPSSNPSVNGSSSQSLIGLYQSLVSKLTDLVSILTSNNANSNSKNTTH
jgi:RHS repeat-associated protein